MLKRALALLLLFSVLIVSLVAAKRFIPANDSAEPLQSSQPQSGVQVIGVLRTSGLTGQERLKLGIKYGEYQLSEINAPSLRQEYPSIEGFYLEKPSSELRRYLGKCVRVRVKRAEIKEMIGAKKVAYGRVPVSDFSLERVEFKLCNPYAPRDDIKVGAKRTFTGILARIQRPAPDIALDYELKQLNEPITYEFTKLYNVAVMPDNNQVWYDFENSIGKKITVEGYLLYGYGETKYVLVERIVR